MNFSQGYTSPLHSSSLKYFVIFHLVTSLESTATKHYSSTFPDFDYSTVQCSTVLYKSIFTCEFSFNFDPEKESFSVGRRSTKSKLSHPFHPVPVSSLGIPIELHRVNNTETSKRPLASGDGATSPAFFLNVNRNNLARQPRRAHTCRRTVGKV